jgi:predicted ferric reductase
MIWAALATATVVPIAAASQSPYIAFRDPVYVVAGFAGAVGMALMLVQPLLAGGALPGLSTYRGRLVHRWIGAALALAVAIHVAGLWVTSPPDVVDALLFVAPTPFSVWGVIAMWALFAAALLAALRRRLRLRPRSWRVAHKSLALVFVIGSVVHALLIEGTMETMSKAALCALALIATGMVVFDLGVRAKQASSD